MDGSDAELMESCEEVFGQVDLVLTIGNGPQCGNNINGRAEVMLEVDCRRYKSGGFAVFMRFIM